MLFNPQEVLAIFVWRGLVAVLLVSIAVAALVLA